VTEERLKELLKHCTHCGLCREVCIVERLGAHSITSFLSGDDEYSSWLCSSCWRCQEVCPQGVDIHTIMILKRREQEAPAGHEANLVSIMRLGYALPVDESVNESRSAYGLDAVQLIPSDRVEILLQADMVEDREDR
jgi:heterodisulfide reductase subunit C